MRVEPAAPPAPAGRTRPGGAGYRPGVIRAARYAARQVAPRLFDLQVGGAGHVPATGPVILAGNHAGFLDGPLVVLLAPRPVRALVKAELEDGPWSHPLRWAGQIPVHRGRPDRRALHGALDVLAAGQVLGLFPEGTRGAGTVEQLQHGIAWLALRHPCPIVPVACLGTAEALPRGRHLPRVGSRIRIEFGAPFVVEVGGDRRARATVALAAEQIRARLVEHLATVAAGPPPGRAAW